MGENATRARTSTCWPSSSRARPGRRSAAHITEELLARQDRVTGDYNAYWHDRDYLHRADRVKASVFVVHGLEDYNVMPQGVRRLVAASSPTNGVPRKIWLHKGGHGGPRSTSDYQQTLNRWMDHWLFGVHNGITTEPRADVQRPDGTYEKYANWPVPGCPGRHPAPRRHRRHRARHARAPAADERPAATAVLRRPRPRAGHRRRLLPNPDVANPNRLAYLSPPLTTAAHLSGTPSVSLRASVDNRYAANLTAVLVDYGPVGSTGAGDGDPRLDGRAEPQARRPQHADPAGPGVHLRLGPAADDYVFPAGHRIGLVVVSTDQQYTAAPDPGTELTVNPAKSSRGPTDRGRPAGPRVLSRPRPRFAGSPRPPPSGSGPPWRPP